MTPSEKHNDLRSSSITSLAVGAESGHEVEHVCGGTASPSSSRRMSTGLKAKARQYRQRFWRRGRSDSSLRHFYFASRDADGSCALWSLESGEAVKSADGVPSEESLLSVFSDEVSSVGSTSWIKERRWAFDRPDTFSLDGRDGEETDGCLVSCNVEDFKVSLSASASAAPCSCAAQIHLGAGIVKHTLYALNRCKDGRWQTAVCCGLYDGTLAIFDFVRT